MFSAVGIRLGIGFQDLTVASIPNLWFSRTHMRRHRSRAESQSSVPLFDWHDRPFVPTCPRIKHRAQRQARLARQGHRRRRPGLAGASTMLSCPRSDAAITADRTKSGSPIGRGGKGAAATHIRSATVVVGSSFPVRRLERASRTVGHWLGWADGGR